MAKKIPELPEFTGVLADDDVLEMVDVSDLTDDPTGSSFKLKVSKITEQVRDTIGATFVAGEGIDITLDDPGNTITIDAELATTSNPGVVELATDSETVIRADGTRAVTPAGLKAVLDVENVALRLPNVSGNYLSTPDDVSLQITGDIDLRAWVSIDAGYSGTTREIIRKGESGSYSYMLRVNTTNGLTLTLMDTGGGASSAVSSANLTVVDNFYQWVRATWRASDQRVQFFTSPDGQTWTQLGTDVATTGITAIKVEPDQLEIGSISSGTSGRLPGKIRRAQVRNGIDGTIVADYRADTGDFGNRYIDSTGKTWTVTGASMTYVDGNGDYVASPTSQPLATTSLRGVVELATNDETRIGQDPALAVSVTGASATYSQTPGLYRPAGTTAYLRTEDHSSLNVAGDLEIVMRVALSDWTPPSTTYLLGKIATTNERQFYLTATTTTGTLSLAWSPDGTLASIVAVASSVGTGFTDGMSYWIKVTRNATTGACNFYTAPDAYTEPTSWTQLGTADRPGAAGAIWAGNNSIPLEIGSVFKGTTAGASVAITVRRVILRSGIGGTVVADYRADTGDYGTNYMDSVGRPWTVSGTGWRYVDRVGNYISGPTSYTTPATEILPGVVELATAKEVKAGIDPGRAVTPATLKEGTTVAVGYPPASPPVGKMWLSPNSGAVAVKGTSQWYPIAPATEATNVAAILGNATLLLDAAAATQVATNVGGDQIAPNLGTGGSVLDARLGSTTPTFARDGYAYLGGGSGDYVWAPDAANLDIVEDIELVARVRPNSWTGTTAQAFVAKWGSANASYLFGLSTTPGVLRFLITSDGSTSTVASSSAAVPFTNGQTGWVKVTRRKSDGRVQFFTASDQAGEPTVWTQLGTDQTALAGVDMFSGTGRLELGSISTGTSNLFQGRHYRGIVRNGIGGTTVLDADFTNVPDGATSFVARTGQTMTVGSSTGSDTNDPLLLPHTGTNYLYLPGTTGNDASVPDAAALDITGDLEFVLRIASTDWTPASVRTIISRTTGVDPNRAWNLTLLTTGALQFGWYPTGSDASVLTAASTHVLPGVDGQALWLKVTLDVDNGAAGNDVKFWYAADQPAEPAEWIQLGQTVTTAGVTSLPNVTSPLYIGVGTTNMFGNYYRVIVRDAIGGAEVVDIDFTTGITSGDDSSFVCTTGQTVTISRSATGRKSVAVVRPIWLFGTDDFLEVPDNDLLDFAAAESFTLMILERIWGSDISDAHVAKKTSSGTDAGYVIRNALADGSQTVLTMSDGAASVAQSFTRATPGVLQIATAVRDVSLDQNRLYQNGTLQDTDTDTTTATLANTLPLRVGNYSANTTYSIDAEVIAVGVWRRVLTIDEITLVCQHYGVI